MCHRQRACSLCRLPPPWWWCCQWTWWWCTMTKYCVSFLNTVFLYWWILFNLHLLIIIICTYLLFILDFLYIHNSFIHCFVSICLSLLCLISLFGLWQGSAGPWLIPSASLSLTPPALPLHPNVTVWLPLLTTWLHDNRGPWLAKLSAATLPSLQRSVIRFFVLLNPFTLSESSHPFLYFEHTCRCWLVHARWVSLLHRFAFF